MTDIDGMLCGEKTYSFETADVKFELIFGGVFAEDYDAGCPYNTVFYVNVDSYGFRGNSEWTVDFCEFQKFACEMNKLYGDLKGETELKDREYGSALAVKCDRKGHFTFNGKLVSGTFQKLEFNFSVDQTFLGQFVKNLFNDYGKDFLPKQTKKENKNGDLDLGKSKIKTVTERIFCRNKQKNK
ncbi:MAG: hypothetical protein LBP62_04040 [Clostridiales bacterium]|jgi:hypothetical protein|nr:hypothetical protein [Clostridiales bacterium]